MRGLALVLSAAALLGPASAWAAPRIGEIRAQLVYEHSGRLSRNIAPPAQFTGWNTIIGEGDAEEPADDLLVLVEVIGDGGGQTVATPLTIVARGRGGRVIARRQARGLLTSAQGRVWKSLWLGDVGCEGRIEIVATLGRSTRRSQFNLDCGE